MRAVHHYHHQAENYLQWLHERREQNKSSLHLGDEGLGYRILHHRLFELSFGGVILCNLCMVIIETDAVALDEKAPAWVDVVSWMILCSFVVELALRLFVLRWNFWLDECNSIDFILVALDLFMNVLGLIAGQAFPVSFLRIVRLSKLTRLAKAFHLFPELRLMMAGLVGALKAIFWGTVLLLFFVVTWSIIAVQFIHPLNVEIAKTSEYANCDRCPRAYSTVFQAALTICQQIIAGDSWGLVSISVIEHYPATAIFYALVFLSVGLAILNLILGVVVDVASQARDQLKGEMETEQLLARQECKNHLLELCHELDQDKNGKITRQELSRGYEENEQFRVALHFMEICEEDLEVLWTLLDMEGSGSISYAEFVTKCHKLKSSDTHFMLAYVKYYVTVMKNQLCAEIDVVKHVENEILEAEKSNHEIIEGRISEKKVGVDLAEKYNCEHLEVPIRVEDRSTAAEAQSSLQGGDAERNCDVSGGQSETPRKKNVRDTGKLHGALRELVARFNEELIACIDGNKTERPVANGTAKFREHDADRLDECAVTKSSGCQSKKLIEKDLCTAPLDLASGERQAHLQLLRSSHKEHVELTASMKAIQEQLDMLVSRALRTTTVSTTMTMPQLLDPPQSTAGSAWCPRDQVSDPWPPLPRCCGGNKVKVLTLPPPHVPAPPTEV